MINCYVGLALVHQRESSHSFKNIVVKSVVFDVQLNREQIVSLPFAPSLFIQLSEERREVVVLDIQSWIFYLYVSEISFEESNVVCHHYNDLRLVFRVKYLHCDFVNLRWSQQVGLV